MTRSIVHPHIYRAWKIKSPFVTRLPILPDYLNGIHYITRASNKMTCYKVIDDLPLKYVSRIRSPIQRSGVRVAGPHRRKHLEVTTGSIHESEHILTLRHEEYHVQSTCWPYTPTPLQLPSRQSHEKNGIWFGHWGINSTRLIQLPGMAGAPMYWKVKSMMAMPGMPMAASLVLRVYFLL